MRGRGTPDLLTTNVAEKGEGRASEQTQVYCKRTDCRPASDSSIPRFDVVSTYPLAYIVAHTIIFFDGLRINSTFLL